MEYHFLAIYNSRNYKRPIAKIGDLRPYSESTIVEIIKGL